MSAIFEYLARSKAADGYAGHCHSCQHALGDLTDKESLQATLFERQNFYPFWFTLPDKTAKPPTECFSNDGVGDCRISGET